MAARLGTARSASAPIRKRPTPSRAPAAGRSGFRSSLWTYSVPTGNGRTLSGPLPGTAGRKRAGSLPPPSAVAPHPVRTTTTGRSCCRLPRSGTADCMALATRPRRAADPRSLGAGRHGAHGLVNHRNGRPLSAHGRHRSDQRGGTGRRAHLAVGRTSGRVAGRHARKPPAIARPCHPAGRPWHRSPSWRAWNRCPSLTLQRRSASR